MGKLKDMPAGDLQRVPMAELLEEQNRVRREQRATWDKMKAIISAANGREMTQAQKRDYDQYEIDIDASTTWSEELKELIGGAEVRDARANGRYADLAPYLIGGAGGRRDTAASDLLLRREQRMSEWVHTHGPVPQDGEEPIRLGALLRGWVTGKRDGMNETELRAMSEGTLTAGGHLVPTPTAAEFIDRARAQSRVIEAGARTVPMETQTLKVPRLTGSSAPAWRNENAAIAAGDMTVDAVTLTARSLAFLVTMSWELVEDSNPSVLGIVEDDLARQVALEIDRVALRGTGTPPEPRGIRNTSGVTVTAFGGANGAAPTNYDLFIDAEQTVRSANFEPSATILSSRTQGTMRKLKEATTNAYLEPPPDMTRWLVSNNIPNNITTGTSNDTSEVYVGDFEKLYLGMRTGPITIQLQERYADNGQVGLIIWFRGDIAVAQPTAFNVVAGVRP